MGNTHSYNTQFVDGLPKVVHDKEMYVPVEGFVGEHVETFAHLIGRMEGGEFVPIASPGVYVDEQLFYDVNVDNFEVMDTLDQYGSKAAGSGQSEESADDNLNSSIAPTEGPSSNSDGDNAGNSELSS